MFLLWMIRPVIHTSESKTTADSFDVQFSFQSFNYSAGNREKMHSGKIVNNINVLNLLGNTKTKFLLNIFNLLVIKSVLLGEEIYKKMLFTEIKI